MSLPIAGSLLALIAPTWAMSSGPLTGLAMRAEVLDGGVDGLLDAAADGRRVGAGGDVPQAFAEDLAGQHRGGRRAVAGHVRGLRGDLVDELGAHVLEAVFQVDFLAHRHAVLGDGRAAVGLVENDVVAGRAQGHGDHVGQFFHTPKQTLPGLIIVKQLFSHVGGSLMDGRVGEVSLLDDLREDVGLAEDLDLAAIDFDFGAGILAVDDFVADARPRACRARRYPTACPGRRR